MSPGYQMLVAEPLAVWATRYALYTFVNEVVAPTLDPLIQWLEQKLEPCIAVLWAIQNPDEGVWALITMVAVEDLKEKAGTLSTR